MKIKSFKGIKKGQKFKVVSNSNYHNYPMNVILTFARDIINNIYEVSNIAIEVQGGNTLAVRDIVLVDLSINNMKEELLQLAKTYLKQREELESKINFCTEVGCDKFDETEFKVYQTLKTIDSKMTLIEKSKIIANLITKGV